MGFDYDCIIIGAGMSGLAAGIRLAYYGKRVCILERHTFPGGLNSFYRIGKRDFDVGLHALTNFVPRTTKGAPLSKLLRQLRLRYEDLDLCAQNYSEVRFPQCALRFGNGLDLLEQQIAATFPAQIDGFRALAKKLQTLTPAEALVQRTPSRQVMAEHIREPLLIEMLLCPLMYYGSAWEHDMEIGQMAIMFGSVFVEGFCRPRRGVRQIIAALLKQYKASHGELRLGCGVRRMIVEAGRVATLELDDGRMLTAQHVLSCAGSAETAALRSDLDATARAAALAQAGRMSFVESISTLDRTPAQLGIDSTIVFYNTSGTFHYRRPDDAVDFSSGVICFPNNFQFLTPLAEGVARVTHMANSERWMDLPEEAYRAQKHAAYQRSLEQVTRIVPDFRPHITSTDVFTPKTIRRFTGHINGAVYGSPRKVPDGRTDLANLFLCGTDQGFLGIIGSLLSGISIANAHVLQN